ncbi:probable G-protein coupled receptor B0563.6 [Haliotis asinina]|uniref:probable G-protein coupled receptor B0563.6 n=1 Tax=Haliotis asinina TaxID=109174 RepID=UPI0035320BE4
MDSSVYIQITLCILGIIGNATSVGVLSKMKSKSLRLLKYLNVVDVVLLVTVCTALMLREPMTVGFAHVAYYMGVCITSLIFVVHTFEAYLTVLIAFVRCMAVAMPFRFATSMRDSVQSRLLIAVAVFSVLFNLPSILAELQLLHGKTSVVWISHFSFFFQQIFCRFLPILAIIICNIILVVSRCRMKSLPGQDNQCRSPNRRHSRNAFQLTCLVLAITTMFIATHGFLLFYDVCYKICDIAVLHDSDLPAIVSFMVIINSATNFIFYCLIGSDFRTALISLCKKTSRSTRRKRSLPVSSV